MTRFFLSLFVRYGRGDINNADEEEDGGGGGGRFMYQYCFPVQASPFFLKTGGRRRGQR